MPTRITAPLAGTVTKGTWLTNQRLTVAAMPNGFMQYNVLLPAQYSTSFSYPVLFYGHENSEGMNGGTYPSDGGGLVNQTTIDGTFNTVAFRTNFPAIVVVPECDQTLDTSGANPNANFGGYADTPNSGGNEQGINALLAHILATYSGDSTRCYCTGDSLGAIGSLAWMVDNNAYNGIHKLWAAGMGFSDQLYRPSIQNANVFPNMASVPYIAVSTPNDNNQQIYDEACWQHFTGNTNYPSPASYSSGGTAAMKAGSSSFWYMLDPTGVPWDTYRQLNADGGQGTKLYNLLFSFTAGSPPPPPPPPPTGNMTITVLLPGAGGSLTGADGHVWTLDASGNVYEDGVVNPGGAGTGALTVVVSAAWGEDSSTHIWYAWDGTNWVQQSGTPAVVPNPVTGLTVGTITSTSVALSWTAPILATGYAIEQSTNGGTTWTSAGTSTTTSHTVTGLTGGTAYQFRAAGTDTTGTGSYSTAVSATTTGVAPGAPTGLTGTVISSSEIDVSWTAPTTGGAATSYTLEATANGGTLTTIASGITGTTYHATGLAASTAYVFDVKAVNSAGPSPASATFSATTPAAVTVASVQAQITQAESLVAQLNTDLSSIYTNVGLL